MIKYITNTWEWGEPALRVAKKTPTMLVKRAGWYGVYKSDPDHTYVNAIFLGADEYWGSNNNGDAFLEDDLVRCHPTFVEHANHFKHHKNDDPSDSYGKVCETHYNPSMRRVEGVIKIINKRSPKMIQDIAEGIMIPLSMACKLPYDVCSICGQKSKKIEDYCNHLQFMMNKILDDGRKVRAFNPNPKFFDISEVVRGADPTAFTLRKLAQLTLDSGIKPVYNNEKCADNNFYHMRKLAILERLAALEKKIEGMITGEATKIMRNAVCDKHIPIDEKDTETLVGALSKNGMALYTTEKGRSHMYRSMLKHPARDTILESMPNPGTIRFNTSLDHLEKEASYKSEFALNRLRDCSKDLSTTISGPCINPQLFKVASINLASICNRPELLNDDIYTKLVVLQNFVD